MSGENNNTAATVTDHSDVTGDTGALTDEDDVHKCGRCLEEFSALQLFLQHKLSRSCKRPGAAPDQQPREAETENEAWSGHTDDSADEDAAPPSSKPPVNLNAEGRCVCGVCQKSFKTANILRTHMFIHSDQKDFKCEICDTAFRTKGSLIRHNRRHTDERPYRCGQCGLAFRESGALTRHLKSLTPCTEKLRYSQCREILVSKDGAQKVQRASAEAEKEEELPVVNVVETAAEIIQIQVLDQAGRVQQVVSQPEASVVEAENLICQAIINSGITLQTDSAHQEPPPKSLLQAPEVEVTEECVETLAEEAPDSEGKEGDAPGARLYKCPHCERLFKTLAYLRVHIKGHVGYKPFKCLSCQKEFLTGYVLKKHMDTHLTERRFKCGECGKLFKAIGHVREHMRAHSDERPYRCSFCDKRYKTKNALQVHHRTHADDKPYECPSCSRGFREKSALIRHIRHHTGEKPFKCARCGRGFAEHGTLNRHMRAKGGCVLPCDPEKQVATPVDPDDPHTLLVEFSSVVADTQEYIIGTPVEGGAHSEEVTIIQDNQQQMDSHIMKVVQQIVSQSHGGHQIIVRNVSADEAPGISDCGDTITIATPESLTEQVAMTLASAIGDGAILAAGAEPASSQQLAVMESHGAEEAEQQFVIASPEEMEIQTVVVV